MVTQCSQRRHQPRLGSKPRLHRRCVGVAIRTVGLARRRRFPQHLQPRRHRAGWRIWSLQPALRCLRRRRQLWQSGTAGALHFRLRGNPVQFRCQHQLRQRRDLVVCMGFRQRHDGNWSASIDDSRRRCHPQRHPHRHRQCGADGNAYSEGSSRQWRWTTDFARRNHGNSWQLLKCFPSDPSCGPDRRCCHCIRLG